MHAANIVAGVAAAVVGLPAGSYATVLAERVPDGQSALRLSGRCPGCEAALTVGEMIPVVGWLRQSGRCAACGQSFGLRYLAAELITAGTFAAFGLRFGPSLLLAPLCHLAVIGVALALIDIEHQRLPHPLTLPSYPVVVGLLALAAAFTTHGWQHLAGSLLGMTVLWLFYALLARLLPGQLGWGDVWLAGLLGLPLGWFGRSAFLIGALAAWLLPLPVALHKIAARRRGQPVSAIALGPFMLAGALLAILVAG